MVFPKLLRLGQAHLKKVSYPVFYNKLIGEIIDSLNGGFPKLLSLKEQGEFIVGYYQQYQSFFEKNEIMFFLMKKQKSYNNKCEKFLKSLMGFEIRK